MACCCVSDARQSSPDVSDMSKPVLKKTDVVPEHYYEAINTNVAIPSVRGSPIQQPPRSPGPKVSRGTQVNTITLPGRGPDSKISSTPPLPAKTAIVSPRRSTPPPPVPPKPKVAPPPAARVSPPVRAKPALLPKPSLPPKPVIKNPARTAIAAVKPSPDKPPRLRIRLPDSAASSTGSLSPVSPAASPKAIPNGRKSSSLGRLEALRYATLIQNARKDSKRDSGFVSCSLECVSPCAKSNNAPVAPPRRRRKSFDGCRDVLAEPIYAMVDFTKKLNRRSLTEVEHVEEKMEASQVVTSNVDVITPVVLTEAVNDCVLSANPQPKVSTDKADSGTCPPKPVTSVDSPKEAEPANESPRQIRSASKTSLPSQLEVIVEVSSSPLSSDKTSEDSVSDIEYVKSSSPPAWCYAEEAPKAVKPQAIDSDIESNIRSIEYSFAAIASIIDDLTVPLSPKLTETSSGDAGQNEVTIARLVIGGAVVDSAETPLVVNQDSGIAKREKMKEFCAVLEDVIRKQPPSMTAAVVKDSVREVSPALSTSSSSSSDFGTCINRRVYEDELSAGILGDVDTSDAARQSSLDEDNDGSEAGSTGLQVRRKIAALFGSFGKPLRKGFRKGRSQEEGSSSDAGKQSQDEEESKAPMESEGQDQGGATAGQESAANGQSDRAEFTEVAAEISKLVNRVSAEPSLVETAAESANSAEQESRGLAESDTNSIVSATSIDSAAASTTAGGSLLEESCEADPSSAAQANSDSEADDAEFSCSVNRSSKAFFTAREICSSERVFVDCLRLLNEDFRSAVEETIAEAELNKILNYLPQLLNLNQELLSDFENRVDIWGADPRISDVIVRKGPFLKLYSSYIRDFGNQCALLDECVQKNARFERALKTFESTPRCQKLSIKHFMLKPVQRVPQYRLLLAEYLRRLDESSPDYSNTVTALKVVSEVADHANNTMKLDDNFQRLMKLQARLGNYELIQPGRVILKEGELSKLCRKTMQPRYFILLNDCLLYTSYVGSASPTGSLKLHNELPLNRMKVVIPLAQDFENEFSVISTTRSFTLAAGSSQVRDEWIAVLNNAIAEFESKLSSLRPESSRRDSQNDSFQLGQQAPVWVPDSRVTMCQLCTAEFTVTFRRHHCRACGKVVCGNCSTHKAPLEYLKFRTARVCDACVEALNRLEEEASSKASSSASYGRSLAAASAAIFEAIPRTSYVEPKERPRSDPSTHPAAQAGLDAQCKRQNRKGKRFIPQRLKESASSAGSQMSGYLWRRSRKSWKRAWFVLKDRVLYLYRASEDVVALDAIPVLGYHAVTCSENFGVDKELVFQLCHPNQSPIIFYAENATLAKRWLDCVRAATIL